MVMLYLAANTKALYAKTTMGGDLLLLLALIFPLGRGRWPRVNVRRRSLSADQVSAPD
jgi:hypothetical protein